MGKSGTRLVCTKPLMLSTSRYVVRKLRFALTSKVPFDRRDIVLMAWQQPGRM